MAENGYPTMRLSIGSGHNALQRDCMLPRAARFNYGIIWIFLAHEIRSHHTVKLHQPARELPNFLRRDRGSRDAQAPCIRGVAEYSRQQMDRME